MLFMTETHWFLFLPKFSFGTAVTQYQEALNASIKLTGSINFCPEEFQYLLRTYKTLAKITEGINSLLYIRQQ